MAPRGTGLVEGGGRVEPVLLDRLCGQSLHLPPVYRPSYAGAPGCPASHLPPLRPHTPPPSSKSSLPLMSHFSAEMHPLLVVSISSPHSSPCYLRIHRPPDPVPVPAPAELPQHLAALSSWHRWLCAVILWMCVATSLSTCLDSWGPSTGQPEHGQEVPSLMWGVHGAPGHEHLHFHSPVWKAGS